MKMPYACFALVVSLILSIHQAKADACDSATLADLRVVEDSKVTINRGGRVLSEILRSNYESYQSFKQRASEAGFDIFTVIYGVPIDASWRQSDSSMEAHWSEIRSLLVSRFEQSSFEDIKESKNRSDISEHAAALMAQCAGKKPLHFWRSDQVEHGVTFTYYYDWRKGEEGKVFDGLVMAPEGVWDCSSDVAEKMGKPVGTERQSIKCQRTDAKEEAVLFVLRVKGAEALTDAQARVVPAPITCPEVHEPDPVACRKPGEVGAIMYDKVTCKGGIIGNNISEFVADLCGPASCKGTTEIAYWTHYKMFGVGNDPRWDRSRSSNEVKDIKRQLESDATITQIYLNIIRSPQYQARWFGADDARHPKGEGNASYAIAGLLESIFGADRPVETNPQDVIDRSNEAASQCGGAVICRQGWLYVAELLLRTRYTDKGLDQADERVLPYNGDPGNRLAYCGPVSDYLEQSH